MVEPKQSDGTEHARAKAELLGESSDDDKNISTNKVEKNRALDDEEEEF
jgi:hypothetical protein